MVGKMVQILILVVLIIIAVILAPWLIGVAAALAALYGLHIVIFGSLMAIVVAVASCLFLISAVRDSKEANKEAAPITGGRVACKSCQAEVSDQRSTCDNCGARL